MSKLARPGPARLALAAALALALAAPAQAGKSTKKQIRELSDQVAALSAQLATVTQSLAAVGQDVSDVKDGLGGQLIPLSSLELCAELAVEGEVEFQNAAEANAAGEGSLGVDAYGNGASVEAKVRGKGELKFGVKGTGALPKLVYCFDVNEAAGRILAARASAGAAGGTARAAAAMPAFDPTGLAPAVQDYVVRLAQLDPVDLTNRMGGIADFVGLDPAGFAGSFDTLALADGGIDPMSILNGEGPLLGLATSLPLPPGIRGALQDPGRLADTLDDFRPCERTDLAPRLQAVVDRACLLQPSWDPTVVAEQFGRIGELATDAQAILTSSSAVQSIVSSIRTGLIRVCNAVDAIPGVNPNCSF